MDWLATLRRSGGIEALARQVGESTGEALAGAEALMPALLDGLRRYVGDRGGGDGGMRDLLALIDAQGNGCLAAAVMTPEPLAVDAGDALLEQLFGGPHPKRARAARAAGPGGGQAALLERLLPALVMLVCGYISARVAAGGENANDWLREALMIEDGGLSRKVLGSGH